MTSFSSAIKLHFYGTLSGAVSYPYFTPEFLKQETRFSEGLTSQGRAIGDDPPNRKETEIIITPSLPDDYAPTLNWEERLEQEAEQRIHPFGLWGEGTLRAWANYYECILACELERRKKVPECWGTAGLPCNCNGPDCVTQPTVPVTRRPDPPTFPCCRSCVEAECERLTGHPWCLVSEENNPDYDDASKAAAEVLCWRKALLDWQYRWGDDADWGCWGCMERVLAACNNVCESSRPPGDEPPMHLTFPYRPMGPQPI